MVRALVHGAMGRRIDPSWWTHIAISPSSQRFTTGVTKAVVCDILSGVVHIKDTLLLIGKRSPCSGGSGFPLLLSVWSFTIYTTPYNRQYNVMSASLNKAFPSFQNLIPWKMNTIQKPMTKSLGLLFYTRLACFCVISSKLVCNSIIFQSNIQR